MIAIRILLVTVRLASAQPPEAPPSRDELILAMSAKIVGVLQAGSPTAVTPNTIFGIGSTTKAFTATAVAMLVDSLRLQWDDRVTRWIPEFRLPDPAMTEAVTIRDLLSHRTGLAGSDFLWYAGGYDRAELIRRARFLRPAAGFRERFEYQNLMFVVAGQVVERASGLRWDDFLRRRIFEPLGMSRTSTSVAALTGQGDVAVPHARLADTVRVIDRRNLDNLSAAGSINSSAADLAEWLRLQLGRGKHGATQLVSPAQLTETRTAQFALRGEANHLEAYGLGWFLRDYRGRLVAEHGGNVDGMTAAIAMIPEERFGVVVLSNLHNSPLPSLLAEKILDRHLGVARVGRMAQALARADSARVRGRAREARLQQDRAAATPPSLALAGFVGRYADRLYGDLEVTVAANGQLRAALGPGLRGVLEHWHHDVFRVRWEPRMWGSAFLTFSIGATGQPNSVEIDLGGEPAPVTFRRSSKPGLTLDAERHDASVALGAKLLCSGVFVAGREPEAFIRDDLAHPNYTFHDWRTVGVDVDRRRRAVTLRPPGRDPRTAVFNDEQGCTLLPVGSKTVAFRPVRLAAATAKETTRPWPNGDRIDPARRPSGIDEGRLRTAVDAAFDSTTQSPPQRTRALVVLHRGEIVAERYAPGFGPETRHMSWSMGKSITSALIGVLVGQGALRADQPAPITEWHGPADPRAAVTVGDLLRMSSGLRFAQASVGDSTYYTSRHQHEFVYFGAVDVFKYALGQPQELRPGTQWRYRNVDPLSLGAIIRRTVEGRGEDYLSFPARRLFEPIGMHRMVLEPDPFGNFLMTGFVYGTARDWARFGLLHLRDGRWDGRRILPAGWVDFVRTPAPASADSSYGGLFWLNRGGSYPRLPRDAYWALGWLGQVVMIIPSRDVVIVRLGHSPPDGFRPYWEAVVSDVLAALP